LLSGIGIFLYEPALMLLPVFGFWILWWRVKGEKLAGGGKASLFLWAGTLLVAGVYLLLRSFYVPQGRAAVVAPISSVIRNSMVSVAGLFTPVDPILLYDGLGVTLPSRAMLASGAFWKLAAPLAAVSLVVFVFLAYWLLRHGWLRCINRDLVVLLSGAAFFSMQPTLWFAPFPSETYLYLPLALLGPVIVESAHAAGQILFADKGRYLLAGILVLWLAQATSAVVLRNKRVKMCGQQANAILSSLPSSLGRAGAAVIGLTPEPGSLSSSYYGPYNYSGLDVIGYNWPGNKAVQESVRLYFNNPHISVELGRDGVPPAVCHHAAWCAWVGKEGAVRPDSSGVGPRPSR